MAPTLVATSHYFAPAVLLADHWARTGGGRYAVRKDRSVNPYEPWLIYRLVEEQPC